MSDSNSGWIKSTCAYCGVGCGIEARPTALGKLEVRGDKEHPSNYGKLCTKGIALGETVTPLGRLTQPTHIKNQQKHELVWDDATQLVADRFNQTIEEFGPDSVAGLLGFILSLSYKRLLLNSQSDVARILFTLIIAVLIFSPLLNALNFVFFLFYATLLFGYFVFFRVIKGFMK